MINPFIFISPFILFFSLGNLSIYIPIISNPKLGPIQSAGVNAYTISIDRTNQIIYISDSISVNQYSYNCLQQIGNPSITTSSTILYYNNQSNYYLSMNGFGFCDQYCSAECNQISLFQNSTLIQDATISFSSCSFNNIQFSVSSNMIQNGSLNATIYVNENCNCGVGGISANAQIANIEPKPQYSSGNSQHHSSGNNHNQDQSSNESELSSEDNNHKSSKVANNGSQINSNGKIILGSLVFLSMALVFIFCWTILIPFALDYVLGRWNNCSFLPLSISFSFSYSLSILYLYLFLFGH